MENRYKVTGPRPVNDTPPGQEFDAEFTVEEETDQLAAGRIQIVPRKYQVVGPTKVMETKPGDYFDAAFPKAQETALLDGGHIERARTSRPKTEKKEE